MGTKGDGPWFLFGWFLFGATLLATAALLVTAWVAWEREPEQVIHVFTHTIDDREVRCIHFSQFGLSCDWTYGDREGIN